MLDEAVVIHYIGRCSEELNKVLKRIKVYKKYSILAGGTSTCLHWQSWSHNLKAQHLEVEPKWVGCGIK